MTPRGMVMKRPKIGDLIAIKTSQGTGYAIFTHQHTAPPKFGSLVRVFVGLHEHKPAYLGYNVPDVLFSTFFPLGTAIDKGLVEIVGNMEVPEPLKAFPTFRNGTPNPKTKKVENWWLWDGYKEWRVGKLDREQSLFPLLSVWNFTLLVERVEKQWRAECDPVWSAIPAG